MSAFVDAPAEPARNRYDVVAALLLGIAATLTALASFLAGDQDGRALEHFSASNSRLNDANFYYTRAGNTLANDVQLYNDFRIAQLQQDQPVADYLRADMSAQLSDAVDWADQQGDGASPFDSDAGSPYDEASEDLPLADEAQDAADAEFQAAGAADDKGDKYGISTVLFALTLFFGGISTLQERPSVTRALLGVAVLSLLAGLVQFGLAAVA